MGKISKLTNLISDGLKPPTCSCFGIIIFCQDHSPLWMSRLWNSRWCQPKDHRFLLFLLEKSQWSLQVLSVPLIIWRKIQEIANMHVPLMVGGWRVCKNMGVSKNRGTPKWMVYNGKSLWKWMIWGEKPLFLGTPTSSLAFDKKSESDFAKVSDICLTPGNVRPKWWFMKPAIIPLNRVFL